MGPAMPVPGLTALGWDDTWAADLAAVAEPRSVPGRVSRVDRGLCTVLTELAEWRVSLPPAMDVAVGDWVGIAPNGGPNPGPSSGRGLGPQVDGSIVIVLPRRRSFRREAKSPGAARPQVVAANIDTVLICNALDGQLEPRHLERFLALVWDGGAVPVVVMTKSDAVAPIDVDRAQESVRATAPGVAVLAVSSTTGAGMKHVDALLEPGRTIALLGRSGAGKSTLVNRVAGADLLAVGPVRADGSGRHTTTHRQLVVLPGRGVLIDTPGMRALSVVGAAAGVRRTFADLEAVAEQCRFSDCSHTGERGCRFPAALAAGTVDRFRLQRWLHLADQSDATGFESDRQAVDLRKRRKGEKATDRRAQRALLRPGTSGEAP